MGDTCAARKEMKQVITEEKPCQIYFFQTVNIFTVKCPQERKIVQ